MRHQTARTIWIILSILMVLSLILFTVFPFFQGIGVSN